jgi:hypothetical protein
LRGDESRYSKVGEDAGSKCCYSNAFDVVVEINGTLKRAPEGRIINSPE